MRDVVIKKSYEEINSKIKKGNAVVVTADQMTSIVKDEGHKSAFKKVDVVTTGTFGTMCSSGAFINFGHTKPKIKASKVWLNDVEAYAGLAAVDIYIGAAQVRENDPLNMVPPGRFTYGGGHVIEDLIAGKQVHFRAKAYGTDCYPLTDYETTLTIKDLRDVYMFNPRNSYQNYNCAVNQSTKTAYTYMGILRPNLGNATFSSAGQLSPLLNDPFYWTIGVGTKIFLGGAVGAVAWRGTQHSADVLRGPNGVPKEGAGTLSITGDMKEMSPEFIRGASLTGYGTSLMVGIGIPIPILNEDLAYFTGVSDENLYCQVMDYGIDYPNAINRTLAEVSYAELKSGSVDILGKKVPASPLSSYTMAKKIAGTLKDWITTRGFTVGEPQIQLPSVNFTRQGDDE